MNSTRHNGKQCKRGCLLYEILFFIGLPFLLLIIGALVFVGRERAARGRLVQRLDQITSEGLPVDDASLQTSFIRTPTMSLS